MRLELTGEAGRVGLTLVDRIQADLIRSLAHEVEPQQPGHGLRDGGALHDRVAGGIALANY